MFPRHVARFSMVVFCAAMLTTGWAQSATTPTKTASRIVSLNGSNTEVLFALGAGPQVIGRDDSAIYPPAVAQLPSVGYQYQLNAEGVLSLRPDLVIGRSDVRPATALEQIKAAGTQVELIKEPTNLKEAEERIRHVGKLVDRSEPAEKLVKDMQADVAAFEKRKAELGDKAKVKAVFLYFRGPKTTFVLGDQTAPGQMLNLVGAENMLGSVGHTAPITAEALIAAQPDVIVTFTHGIETVGGIDGVKKVSGVAQTPAGKNNRFVVMDDLYLGGFTNRAGKAALDLLEALQGQGVSEVKGR